MADSSLNGDRAMQDGRSNTAKIYKEENEQLRLKLNVLEERLRLGGSPIKTKKLPSCTPTQYQLKVLSSLMSDSITETQSTTTDIKDSPRSSTTLPHESVDISDELIKCSQNESLLRPSIATDETEPFLLVPKSGSLDNIHPTTELDSYTLLLSTDYPEPKTHIVLPSESTLSEESVNKVTETTTSSAVTNSTTTHHIEPHTDLLATTIPNQNSCPNVKISDICPGCDNVESSKHQLHFPSSPPQVETLNTSTSSRASRVVKHSASSPSDNGGDPDRQCSTEFTSGIWWQNYCKIQDQEIRHLKTKMAKLERLVNDQRKSLQSVPTSKEDDTSAEQAALTISHLQNKLKTLTQDYQESEAINNEWKGYRESAQKQLEVYQEKISRAEQTNIGNESVEHEIQRRVAAITFQQIEELEILTQRLKQKNTVCEMLECELKVARSELSSYRSKTYVLQNQTRNKDSHMVAEVISENKALLIQLKTYEEDFRHKSSELREITLAKDDLHHKLKQAELEKTKIMREVDQLKGQLLQIKHPVRLEHLSPELSPLRDHKRNPAPSPIRKPQIVPGRAVPGTTPMTVLSLDDESSLNAWACSRCTFMNSSVRSICEICGYEHTQL